MLWLFFLADCHSLSPSPYSLQWAVNLVTAIVQQIAPGRRHLPTPSIGTTTLIAAFRDLGAVIMSQFVPSHILILAITQRYIITATFLHVIRSDLYAYGLHFFKQYTDLNVRSQSLGTTPHDDFRFALVGPQGQNSASHFSK